MNGVKLAAADYTATNGSDVVLATAALVNDIIEIVAFTSFVASGGLAAANNLSDVVSASTSRTNLGITLPNLGVTSTAAELNTLDAVPRGSIIYGNSSAATARLSKGATGTVLTAGADDISWVEASGGGSQTFVASGSITAGNIVGITSEGKVAVQTAAESVPTSPDAAADYQGTLYYPAAACFDTNTGKLFVAYQDTTGTNQTVAFVGTISGTSISFGSKVVVSADDATYMNAVFDDDANKILLSWKKILQMVCILLWVQSLALV